MSAEPLRLGPSEEVRALVAQEHFVDRYMSHPPYDEYITSVGLTNRLTLEWSKQAGTRSRNEVIAELRQLGEDPDEKFIMIGLRRPLPLSLGLPPDYNGFKIHTEVVGEAAGYLGDRA